MSKYTFKRKEAEKSEPKQENRIMNSSASPEENTAVFTKPEKEPLQTEDNSIFLPFDLEEEKPKRQKRKSVGFSFNGFIKQKDNSEEAELEELDMVSKVEDILKEDISVDEIKENLTSGKKVDLADVFSGKKAIHVDEDEEEDFEEEVVQEADDGENDTYEGLEETAIEEPEEDDAPSPVYDKQSPVEGEDDDIYTDIDEDFDEVPVPHRPIKLKKEKKKEIREYNNPEEKEEFTELYRKKGQTALLALIATFVSTLVLIYLETKHLPHPIWLMPGKYGILYLMLDLQFVFISAICILNSLIDGAIHLFSWKPNKNSVTFVTFLISVIQILLHLAFNKYSKDISLYSSVFSLCAVVCALMSYIDCRREHISFRVAASSKTKNVATALDNSSVEYEKFNEYLPEDASLYKISKTSFVSNFFKTNARTSPFNEVYKITLPLVVLASVIFAVLSITLVKGTVCDAINNFALAVMMALPLSSLLVVSLPFFFTTLRLSRLQSAIIGEAAIEEYANTSLISFADIDVFHPKGIKITSIKTYGKSRIDNTYLVAAKLFNLVGGPLKEVFNRSVIATMNDLYNDEILSVTQTGITASIENHKVYVGSGDYMDANGFAHIDDAIDSTFVSSNGRIMYIAIDDEVSAKFYIKYALGVNFKALLDSFNNLGICMAISTRDPNLDTKFVTQILKDDTYPIVVVKNETLPSSEENHPTESETSGIVSASSVPNMLRTVLSADRLSRIISINTLAKCISLILAFTVIIVAFLVDGSHEKITPLFIMLYQLVWSLPIVFTSIFG